MYAKHGNLVDAEASGAKASTKHLRPKSCLDVIKVMHLGIKLLLIISSFSELSLLSKACIPINYNQTQALFKIFLAHLVFQMISRDIESKAISKRN